MTPGELVRSFIRAIEAKDLDLACTMVTDDCEYDNVPMSKAYGPEGIKAVLEPFLAGCGAVDWVIHRQAESGNVVMNERTDRFEMGGKWIELLLVGVWEVRDGKICLWRDYFDLGQFQKAVSGS